MRRAVLLTALLTVLPCLGTACGGSGSAPRSVAPSSSSTLSANPSYLAFDVPEGGPNPAARRVTVGNTGSGDVTWTASETCPWITLSTSTGGDGDGFDVLVDAAGQAVGIYQEWIALTHASASNSPLQIPVSLAVSAAVPGAACGCDALPAPTGSTVQVTDVAELTAAVQQANTGTGPKTIRVADGTYVLSQPLQVTADDITICSASGDRDGVVLKGNGMSGTVSHVLLVRGSRFTVADLSLGWVTNHAIQIQGEQDADDALVHNVRFVDTGEQMLKVSYSAGMPLGSDRGIVECCLFEYTAGIGPQYYIGGIDCHQGADWVVRRNTFRGIRSPEAPLAEHAIHFWSGSSGTLVEGNVIIDCDRGIGFGLGSRGHQGGVIKNNMVYTTRDVGIGLETATGVTVLHNSVYAQGYPNAIEYRFAMTSATIEGNLTYGAIALRDGASGSLSNNYVMAQTDDFFVDPPTGDLHLSSAVLQVVDQVPARADVTHDLDCDARPTGPASDIGADEWDGD